MLARFVVGSHIKHHPSSSNKDSSNASEEVMLNNTSQVPPVAQELLRKYIMYAKERVRTLLFIFILFKNKIGEHRYFKMFKITIVAVIYDPIITIE